MVGKGVDWKGVLITAMTFDVTLKVKGQTINLRVVPSSNEDI